MDDHRVVIIGAGPAGLTAAYELARRGVPPLVVEQDDKVGGLARTEVYKGYRFDIGGHRFFTKVTEVERLWREVLQGDLLEMPRRSRIYYRGRFFKYPLDLLNTFINLGPTESALILLSYLRARLRPYREEETFDRWVTNRFGRRLYKTFFQTYTEKVWGIPCHMIRADWAAQRIRGLSLVAAMSNALFGTNHVKSLINRFHYPALGPGMMWERLQALVEGRGGRVCLNTAVLQLHRRDGRITAVAARRDGAGGELAAEHFISTMPLAELVSRLDPPAPREVAAASSGLSYRALIVVGLIVNRAELFPDQWIYVHSPDVRVGRIQNYKNWSGAMVPDPGRTGLGMEYFCSQGDEIWTKPDDRLIEMAAADLVRLGLARAGEIEDGVVFRQPHAYPVYDAGYRERVDVIRRYLSTIENLQTIGRGGLHRYNNQDHSMLTAMLAVRNLLGESQDVWSVNTERSYHEEVAVTALEPPRPSSQAVPVPGLAGEDAGF